MARGPSLFKQSDVKRAILATRAAGLEIAGVAFLPDGSPLIMTKTACAEKPDDGTGETEGNTWDGVL